MLKEGLGGTLKICLVLSIVLSASMEKGSCDIKYLGEIISIMHHTVHQLKSTLSLKVLYKGFTKDTMQHCTHCCCMHNDLL